MKALKSIPVAYGASVVLTIAIFLIDLITPAGTAEWLGYILPIMIAALTLTRRFTLVLTTVCCGLLVLAFRLEGLSIAALFNRLVGMGVIWTTTILLLQRKRADEEIRGLNATLERRAAELAAANRDLERLNLTLEERVREEVRQNRDKDYLLILKSRQAAMGEMISNIAHQWRQPLFALELFVRDTKECHDSGQLTAGYLDAFVDKAIRAIRQMSQTVDDFMNFLKPNKAKVPFTPREVVDKALSFMEWGAGRPTITFDCDEGGDCPVTGFPNEYTQVLLNILQNARDVLAERGIAAPAVRIRAFGENGRSVVTVADNAGGVADEVMARVFDPYFTTKEEGKGTGIGLYMSRMIIERNMGGRLTVRNTGEGAEFRIEV
ncbi:MAG TPA: HAMP domain-containing sensor histidine kinase [Geobacteraceae bacterium]